MTITRIAPIPKIRMSRMSRTAIWRIHADVVAAGKRIEEVEMHDVCGCGG
jgi:hypothetical protein